MPKCGIPLNTSPADGWEGVGPDVFRVGTQPAGHQSPACASPMVTRDRVGRFHDALNGSEGDVLLIAASNAAYGTQG